MIPLCSFARALRRGAFALAIALLNAAAIVPAVAQTPAVAAPERPLVFVPGLLGSRLCRPGPDGKDIVVWGTIGAIEHFPSLALMGGPDDIKPCGLIHEISFLGVYTQDFYGPFIASLEQAGYRDGETLFIFDYDWRLSVFENAKRLAAFVEASVPGDTAIDIVAHSMGGLVARTYAHQERGARGIARLISAGTPWRGSVKAFDLVENGWGAANVFMGGLANFRRTILSFPMTFELMPDYEGCCGGSVAERFDAGRPEAWIALDWEGVEAASLPDFAGVRTRQMALRKIVDDPLPADIAEVLVIGLDQRTSQQYALETSKGLGHFDIRTSWEGDGTVMRESAQLDKRVTYRTSFSTHDVILNDASVQEFLAITLTKGPAVAITTVPVRERTSILTAVGDLVDLVGAAVVTDETVYRTGTTARATVHIRPDVMAPIDAASLSMTVARAGGPAIPVALTADPGASDPTNPYEQSFSAHFDTGPAAGEAVVSVTIDTRGVGAPRVVRHTVPVLAR